MSRSKIITVLPALNSAATLPRTLESLAEAEREGLNRAWILADGGSRDATISIARRAGCLIVTGAQGRGAQLAAGAEAARRWLRDGDWLLFLHSDTALEPGWSRKAAHFMADNAGLDRAGYFAFALDDPGRKARDLERAVAWRCRMFALPYGDQGLLLPAAFYDRLGGYRPWPLFEDVDLVRRIGRRRLRPAGARALTSAARFRDGGYRRRSLKNILLLARYYMGADPKRLAQAYRK